MTYTRTATQTFTRIVFLKIQLRWALRESTNIDNITLDKFMYGVDQQWIKTFYIYAFNENNLCRAQLLLDIDWDEYNHQVSIGKATVATDVKWKENILIEVEETVRAFNEFVQGFRLRTEWRVTYTNKVWNNQSLLSDARKALGTYPGEPIKWDNKKTGMQLTNKDFSDLRIGLYLAD